MYSKNILALSSCFNSYCPAEYTEKDPFTCNFHREALNFSPH